MKTRTRQLASRIGNAPCLEELVGPQTIGQVVFDLNDDVANPVACVCDRHLILLAFAMSQGSESPKLLQQPHFHCMLLFVPRVSACAYIHTIMASRSRSSSVFVFECLAHYMPSAPPKRTPTIPPTVKIHILIQ